MGHELARMTWVEVGECLRRDPVVLLPVGAVECEGPHLPLGSDYLMAEYVALEVARRTGSVVAPGIQCGISPGLMGFPGTIALKPETLGAVLRDTLRCLARQGFRRFLLVCNHGPNAPVAETVAREIMDECEGVIAALVWPSELARKAAQELGIPEGDLGHGGEPTTSMMLAIASDCVRMDLAVAGRLPCRGDLKLRSSSRAELKGIPMGWYVQVSDWSPTGVSGNPLGATAERGWRMLERVCEMVREVVLFLAAEKRGEDA